MAARAQSETSSSNMESLAEGDTSELTPPTLPPEFPLTVVDGSSSAAAAEREMGTEGLTAIAGRGVSEIVEETTTIATAANDAAAAAATATAGNDGAAAAAAAAAGNDGAAAAATATAENDGAAAATAATTGNDGAEAAAGTTTTLPPEVEKYSICGCTMINDQIWTVVWAVLSVLSILAATLLMRFTDNSIRQAFANKKPLNLNAGLISVVCTFAGIYPLLIIGLSRVIYLTPDWHTRPGWLKNRLTGLASDILLFVMSAYLGLYLHDTLSLVIAYICCAHFIPMGNLIGAFENTGAFDGVLSISLGATLVRVKGPIFKRLVVITAIATFFFILRHLSEHCRNYRSTKKVRGRTDADTDLEAGRT